MSTDERREELLRILMGGERTNIPFLSRHLNASVSTIKRDLLVLTVDRGYPIMTEQGNGGGCVYDRVSSLSYAHLEPRPDCRAQYGNYWSR